MAFLLSAPHRGTSASITAIPDLAKEAPLGQVKVHKKDGNMEYESTYGEDPRRSPS
jgi:predicted class III extradiol MEMO1 family dioxygenase